jgi:hypothetical protein
MLPPVRVWKILFKQNLKLCCYSGISVRCSCAHGITKGQVPSEPMLYVNSTRGVRQFGFWEHSRDCLLLRRRLQTAATTLLRRRQRQHGWSGVLQRYRRSWVYVSISHLYLCVVLSIRSLWFLFICMFRNCSFHHDIYVCVSCLSRQFYRLE